MTEASLPTKKSHVSYSELRDWMWCSWRHQLKHVRAIDLDPRGDATIIGTVFHECVEIRLNGAEPIRSAIVALTRDELEKVSDLEKRDAFDVESCVDRALQLSLEALPWLDQQFTEWEFVEAEENLYEKMTCVESKHEDVFFKGFIDLVLTTTDSRGKKITWILDWKTTTRPWDRRKKNDPKTTYQLSLYKTFWCAKHGVDPRDVRCGFVCVLKNGKPGKTFSLIPVSVGPTTKTRTLTVLDNFVGSVKRGIAVKRKTEENCRWCEYRQTRFCP